MKVVALVSGGKDSCYNMMKCVAAGHEIVALANLQPSQGGELDSYMFQTVGHEGIHLYAEAMGLPLYRATTNGVSVTKEMTYHPSKGDEVEDLYELLFRVKQEVVGGVEGVASGAILSDYQRLRVESVCDRLGLVSLAYLWRREQDQLLADMVKDGLEAVIIKVAAMGLLPDKHLGKSIKDLHSDFQSLNDRYGINVCGEGGEYESFTLDCPLFKKKIVIEDCEVVVHSADAFAPVAYLHLTKLRLQDKGHHNNSLNQKAASREFDNNTHFTRLYDESKIKHARTSSLWLHRQVTTVTLSPNHTHQPSLPDVSKPKDQEVAPQEDGNVNSSTDISPDTYSFVRWRGSTQMKSVEEQAADLFVRFGASLHDSGCVWSDSVLIYLWLSDMSYYHRVNKLFLNHFPNNPPARVCVGGTLPVGEFLHVDVLVLPGGTRSVQDVQDGEEGEVVHRHCMHVQSVSEWAPANIGPYSQAYTVGPVVFLAGQIGLDPASMTLVPGALSQARLSLRHTRRVLRANRSSLSTSLCGTCYYTTEEGGRCARQALSSIDQDEMVSDVADGELAACPVMFIQVSSLPRAADVEWHFISVRDPHIPSYWSSTEYVETAGVLSVQEAWCEELDVGAWLVETALPYWHYSSGSIDVMGQMLACVEQLQSLLKRHDATAASEVTCVNVFLPQLDLDNSQIKTDVPSLLRKKMQNIAAAINVTTTSEPWETSRRVTLLAIKLSLYSS